MQKSVRSLSAIAFAEGLLTFLWLAALPKSGSTFSSIRIGSLLVILGVSVIWLLVYFQTAFTIRAVQFILNWKGKNNFAFLCICLPLLALSVALQHQIWSQYLGDAAYARLFPLLIWGSVLSIQVGLFFLFPNVDSSSVAHFMHPIWKPAGILLAGFLLIWGFIATTKIGITDDVVGLSWGPPGTPITFGQVFLVFALSINLIALYILVFAKFIQKNWQVDAIIFVGLWALAVFLWQREPMIPSHFAPDPIAPNFEYYPNSDAAVFDTAAYQLLYGTNFNHQLFRRPLYVGLLALYHQIAGPGYAGTIFLQILTLALIPSLIYLLVTKLSNRLAGLLTGGLIVLREANAIHLSGEIVASHAKLIMSDLMTMLGVVAILYILATLLTNPKHNPWLLAILGATVGLTTLVRAQTMIIFVPILLFMTLAVNSVKTGLRQFVFVFLGFVLVLSPWVWRNWNLTGTFVLDDRGEERLLARDYSSNPISLPLPLPNETEQEFSTRLHQQVLTYTMQHPSDVIHFASNHFFHNMLDSVLPIAPLYSDVSPDILIKQIPFWVTWDSTLTNKSKIFLLINLALIAIGVAVVQEQFPITGWFPLVVFLVYSGGNALVRSSGWRFSLPVDWIMSMYYCIAFAYIPSKLWESLPHNNSQARSDQSKLPSRQSILMPVVLALMFLMGAAAPIAEHLIPTNNFENLTSAAKETLDQTKTLSTAQIDTFLQQKDAVLLSGIELYPRYDRPNNRVDLPDLPNSFSYLNFSLINNGAQQIVLPLLNTPTNIPHTSKVSVLGCKTKGYISASVVIIHSQPEQILLRVPGAPLHCPLAEPN
jgi:hypothetical protein